jgi:hypothetical protein
VVADGEMDLIGSDKKKAAEKIFGSLPLGAAR